MKIIKKIQELKLDLNKGQKIVYGLLGSFFTFTLVVFYYSDLLAGLLLSVFYTIIAWGVYYQLTTKPYDHHSTFIPWFKYDEEKKVYLPALAVNHWTLFGKKKKIIFCLADVHCHAPDEAIYEAVSINKTFRGWESHKHRENKNKKKKTKPN